MSVNPTRVPSGTSYEAKGQIPTPAEVLKEKGSSRGSEIRETVPDLANKTASARTYAKMMRSDASVRTSVRAGKVPVLGADFYIEPATEDPLDLDAADFVDFNIFSAMTTPFGKVMEEALRCFEQGYSVVEKVLEIRDWVPRRPGANHRKYTMLRKLAPRPVSTIKSIEYDDNGGPVQIIQNAIMADNKPKEVPIGIEQLMIFTFDQQGGNLEGNSILRSAYPHWYYKRHLYNIDAIQKERHGIGVPDVELPPGATQADADAAWELVQNLRTNESSGIVRPTGMNVGFAKVEGQLVDVMKSIEHHNGMIMLNVMAQFLIMGLTAGGGRATTASQLDMFTKSMKYMANYFCDMFNLYLIPQLMVYNYDTDKFPKMKVRNVGEDRQLQMFASALANLAARGLITMDDETEDWVRRTYDMPTRKTPRPTVVAPTGQPAGPGSPNGTGKGRPLGTGKGDVQPKDGNTGNMPADTNVV